MCINCNIYLRVTRKAAAALVGEENVPDDVPDANDAKVKGKGGAMHVLASHRQVLELLRRRVFDSAELVEAFPEVRQGIADELSLEHLDDLDIEDLFEEGGLRSTNFTNADRFDVVVVRECAGFAVGTVTPKADPPPPRTMPEGYPLDQLCYQSCSMMRRGINRGLIDIEAVLRGGTPPWKATKAVEDALRVGAI